MPKGFIWLILAQSLGGLADNTLLVLGIFFLHEQGYPGWWAPLLKLSFTLSYVLLASVVGPLADAFAKASVMLVLTGIKILAVILLLFGIHPLWVFALTGFAASVYAPAKYGLLVEAVHPHHLIQANARMEVSVVLSVLGGVVLGGWLTDGISVRKDHIKMVNAFDWSIWLVETELILPLLLVLAIYGVSALMNVGVFTIKVRTHRAWCWRETGWHFFWRSHQKLWADPLGGLSMRVTALCWGVGAVLQFTVLVWAQTNAQLSLQNGAYLQGIVALGVIGGAFMAAAKAATFKVRRCLLWGLVLAVLLPCLALTHDLWLAVILLVLAGWSGGMLLIPMNALLQKRGQRCMTAGCSIAVQGFNENLSVLIMLGVYSFLLSLNWSLLALMVVFSLPLWMVAIPWLRSQRRWSGTL